MLATVNFMDVAQVCLDFYSSFFAGWCCENPQIAGYISVVTFDPRLGKSQSEFAKTRKSVHQQVLSELHKFRDSVVSLLSKMKKELKILSSRAVPSLGRLVFDSNDQNMVVRKIAFLELEMMKMNTAIFNKRFAHLSDIATYADAAIDIFERPNLIPEVLYLTLESNFYYLGLDQITRSEEDKLSRLSACHRHLVDMMKRFERPLWLSDYPLFLDGLIDEALSHHRFDKECSYVPPLDREVSLSRCLLESSSRYVVQIDCVICKCITSKDFVSEIVKLCCNLIPERETMPPIRQSVALLIMFRAVFHRFYEKFSSLLFKPPSPDLKKVWAESALPAGPFNLPESLMSRNWPPETPIGEVFAKEPLFLPASQFLFSAIFEPNPIDAIYCVHKSLLSIKKGAIINGNRGDVFNGHQCVCFDDFFSLFIGVLFASDVPDVFHLSWFISTYLPKEALSSSLFYACTNLEALASHFKTLPE